MRFSLYMFYTWMRMTVFEKLLSPLTCDLKPWEKLRCSPKRTDVKVLMKLFQDSAHTQNKEKNTDEF